MLFEIVSTLAFIAATVLAGDAPVVSDNIPGVGYTAGFPQGGSKEVKALIAVSTGSDGYCNFTVNINGGPYGAGPYTYHIHQKPVPEDGNCTATAGHLDPYGAGSTTPCDKTKPASCEVGDLSGKYGSFDTAGYSTTYTDKYCSLNPTNQAFVGDKSIVIHDGNKTRIACANFKLATKSASGTNSTNGTSSSGSSSGSASSTPSSSPTGAAGGGGAAGNAAVSQLAGQGTVAFAIMLSGVMAALL